MIKPKEWKKLKAGDLLYIAPPRSTCIKTAKINEVNDNYITIKYDNGGACRVYPPRTHIFFVNKNDAIECLMLFVKNEIKKQEEILLKLQNQLEKDNGK